MNARERVPSPRRARRRGSRQKTRYTQRFLQEGSMRLNSQPVPSDLISYAMRHKYQTTALVLARSPRGEMSATVALLTADLGLIRARVQGVRRPGALLAAAPTTFAA